jgi:hypothetical protein
MEEISTTDSPDHLGGASGKFKPPSKKGLNSEKDRTSGTSFDSDQEKENKENIKVQQSVSSEADQKSASLDDRAFALYLSSKRETGGKQPKEDEHKEIKPTVNTDTEKIKTKEPFVDEETTANTAEKETAHHRVPFANKETQETDQKEMKLDKQPTAAASEAKLPEDNKKAAEKKIEEQEQQKPSFTNRIFSVFTGAQEETPGPPIGDIKESKKVLDEESKREKINEEMKQKDDNNKVMGSENKDKIKQKDSPLMDEEAKEKSNVDKPEGGKNKTDQSPVLADAKSKQNKEENNKSRKSEKPVVVDSAIPTQETEHTVLEKLPPELQERFVDKLAENVGERISVCEKPEGEKESSHTGAAEEKQQQEKEPSLLEKITFGLYMGSPQEETAGPTEQKQSEMKDSVAAASVIEKLPPDLQERFVDKLAENVGEQLVSSTKEKEDEKEEENEEQQGRNTPVVATDKEIIEEKGKKTTKAEGAAAIGPIHAAAMDSNTTKQDLNSSPPGTQQNGQHGHKEHKETTATVVREKGPDSKRSHGSKESSSSSGSEEEKDLESTGEDSFKISDGLTTHEAEELLKHYGRNELPEKKHSKIYLFCKQLWQPMPVMIWIAVVIEAAIQNYIDMAILLAIQFINAGIGFHESSKAKDAVAALKQSLKPIATASRDGKFQDIDGSLLVPGDLVLLRSGSAVPADCRINQGEIDVDESALTGESLPVVKYQGDKVRMGSNVVRGETEATVEFTGGNTFFGKTAALLTVRMIPFLFLYVFYFISFSLLLSLCSLLGSS